MSVTMLNNLKEEDQIRAVTTSPDMISRISKPSEAVQIAAITRGNNWILQIILNKGIKPSEQVQLASAKTHGESTLRYLFIKGIKPSDAVIAAAVKQNGNAIEHVLYYRKKYNIKVTDELLVSALSASESYDLYSVGASIIKSGLPISEEMQIKIIELEPFVIEDIPNPSEAVQLAAVRIRPYMLKHIQNPSDQVLLTAVTTNPNVIVLVDKDRITPAIKKEVLKYILKLISMEHDVRDILYNLKNKNLQWPELDIIERDLKTRRKISESREELESATEAEQIDVVKKHPWKIIYIDQPSEAVQMAALTSENSSKTINIIDHLLRKGITPSEQVQMTSAAKNGVLALNYLIMSRVKPSKQVLLTALAQNGNALAVIFEKGEKVGIAVTEELILAALQGDDPDGENKVIQTILENVPEPKLSERVQLAMANRSGYVLEYLANPSKAVQLAAVKQQPMVIDCVDKSDITNEFKNIVLKALLNFINAKEDIGVNRRRAVTLYFTLRDKNIKWPELDTIQKTLQSRNIIQESDLNYASEEKQIIAVTSHPMGIKNLIDPSEAVQVAAVEAHPEAIEYIHSPSEAVQVAAVSKNGELIKHIDDPSEKVQLAAVQNDPYWAIAAIVEKKITPSEQVQLTAISRDGAAIHWLIDHKIMPTIAVQLAAVENSGYALKNVADVNPQILKLPHVKRIALKTLLMFIKDEDFYEAEHMHHFLSNRTDWPELDIIDQHVNKSKIRKGK